jgi:hypothetical protein
MATACPPPSVRPCHGRGAGTPVSARLGLGPRATRPPGAPAPGRVPLPAVLSRPPRAGSTRASADPLFATRGGPRGATPPGAGARPGSVPHRRRHSAAMQMAGRCTRPLHAVRGVPGPVAVTSGAARGARPRVDHLRPRRRAVGRPPAAYARTPPRPPGVGGVRARAPRRGTPRRAAPAATAPGRTAIPRTSVATGTGASRRAPTPSRSAAGRHTSGSAPAPAS